MQLLVVDEHPFTCPHCHAEIRLTESLAAPLIAATRREYEALLARKDAEAGEREGAFQARERQLADARQTLESRVAARVNQQIEIERAQLIAAEAHKAEVMNAALLAAKSREVTDLQAILAARETKLAEAQLAQAALVRKERELDDAARELELNLEKRVTESLGGIRESAKREAEDALKLKVLEKDATISSMQQKIEELKRRSEQGSEQLRGEVQELELEAMLRAKFPHDEIEPVAKGEFGGDILQRVVSFGVHVGAMLWETKRTRNWNDGWLVKLREDQRTAKAEIAILVSHALPKGIETFDVIDGVWITNPRAALPVATALRETLLQVAMARRIVDGQQTKAELIYEYLTGPRFKQRVATIVEAFTTLSTDLDHERRVIQKQWAKREMQIDRVMRATVGMHGDLQGIAGKSLQEIEGIEPSSLDYRPDPS